MAALYQIAHLKEISTSHFIPPNQCINIFLSYQNCCQIRMQILCLSAAGKKMDASGVISWKWQTVGK